MNVGRFFKRTHLQCGLLCFIAFAAVTSHAQTLSGRWAAAVKTLDNGEVQTTLLELRQDGNEVTGTIHTWGFSNRIKGTVTGTHFEIFNADEHYRKPILVGDLINGELRAKLWGDQIIAHPATPGDEFPTLPYIPPPALYKVPSNGLAKTPPMGWNSWNLFAGRIDDQIVRTMADAMVSSGMRDVGYIYVNIDDTWEGVRDMQGNLQSNHKFPNMKALADYVHSKGLKLGIYSSPGPRTCAGYPASYVHEAQDAQTFAAWGVDYLKYDWCSASRIYKNDDLQPIYQLMGDSLRATGRSITYSLCEYGTGSVEKWGADVSGNLWRTTGGSVAVGVVNLGSAPAQAVVTGKDLPLVGHIHSARDLWAHKRVRFTHGSYAATVPSHGVLLLRVYAK